MNSHKLYRIKGTVCDLLLAVMILVFTLSVAMSATVGNVGFYSHFLDNKQITALKQLSTAKPRKLHKRPVSSKRHLNLP